MNRGSNPLISWSFLWIGIVSLLSAPVGSLANELEGWLQPAESAFVLRPLALQPDEGSDGNFEVAVDELSDGSYLVRGAFEVASEAPREIEHQIDPAKGMYRTVVLPREEVSRMLPSARAWAGMPLPEKLVEPRRIDKLHLAIESLS